MEPCFHHQGTWRIPESDNRWNRTYRCKRRKLWYYSHGASGPCCLQKPYSRKKYFRQSTHLPGKCHGRWFRIWYLWKYSSGSSGTDFYGNWSVKRWFWYCKYEYDHKSDWLYSERQWFFTFHVNFKIQRNVYSTGTSGTGFLQTFCK